MEKGRQDAKTSCRTVLPDDVTSSRFLCNFQGIFHPVNANASFVDKRVLTHEIPESNEANSGHRIRSELLSSLSSKKKLFQVGSQHRTREGKSWVLASEGGNYGGQQHNTKPLSLPFLVHTRITECNSPVSRDYLKEIATFESAAQAASNKDNKEYKFDKTLAHQNEKQDKFIHKFDKTLAHQNEKQDKFSNESAKNKRKESTLEDDLAAIGPRERESYWERRKKNNASAKRSREARKARELQTQIKAAFLERENLRIHAQLMIVQQENACLKRVLCAKM